MEANKLKRSYEDIKKLEDNNILNKEQKMPENGKTKNTGNKSPAPKIIIGVVAALAVIGLVAGGIYLATRSDNATIVSNETTNTDGPIALKDGKNVIEKGGTYTFTGSTKSGKIEVDTTEDVKLVLDNVSITSTDSAAIKCQEGSNVEIELVGENTLTSTDKGDATNDPSNVISSDGKLTFTGTGSANISGNDKGIKATETITINNGTYKIKATEGIEATVVTINGGDIYIEASDDGINGSQKSTNYTAAVEINGGNITIVMGQGDTDAIDSNGNLYINGGTLTITAQSPFDYDGEAKYTGGTMIINGETTTEITNQFANGMGGMMPGGQAGQGDGQANGQQGTPPQGNQGGQAPSQQGGTNTRQR